MKNLIRYLSISLSLFSLTAWAEVVQVEYLDNKGAPAAKYAPPYYINPQSTFSAAVTAGVGRHIMLEVKNTKGDLVFTQSKNRVLNQDTFVVNGVTYFGAKFDVTKLDDGQYTLTSIVSDGEIEVSRQTNALTVDTKTPAIVGDFYWQHFGNYAYKHSDNKFIISPVHGSDAGFPSIDPGASGFSHGTFSSEYLDGPKAGTFHAQNLPLLLTDQGKIIIGNGNLHTITTAHIPDNIANQMRLTYTIFNKVGASSSRSVDVYVATRKAPRPVPYGIFTGVSSQLDNIPVFTGFVPYVPGMTIPNNPVRMLYRAPKEFYLGGGGNAEIYGSWINGSRRANRVVHTDGQFVYFDLTGSTDGKQYGSLQHYTRDVSTWRNHFFIHDLVVPSNMAPPKSTGFSFFVQGKNQWLNSDLAHHITKFDTNGATDSISKIRVQVEPRAYEQRFSYDFRNTGNSTRFGNCIIPASGTECTIDTSLPFPGDDLHQYHNRHMITNLTNTLFSPEIVSSWLYDGSIAELDPASIVNDSVNKTITFSVIDKFKDRANAVSTVRVMDAFAVNNIGVKRKLTRTKYDSTPLTSSNQLFSATHSYSGLPDGTYSLEGYVEDGFSGVAMRNKSTHVLSAGIAIDTTPPKISTNILGGAIKALRSIEIKVLDNSESSITSAILTGGKDDVNISLPIVKVSSNKFRPEHIYIAPSETIPYTMTVKALDAFGNASTHVEKFFYVPVIIKLPEIKQPAIASPLKSASGIPSNVIQTPQVKNPLGELAQGNHEAIFTVLPTATSGMFINGQLILPGETKHFTVNLSQTNHRLTFEAYPEVSGQALTNQFEINLPDVRVSLCPATFELNSEQCISVKFTNPDLKCSSPYALNNASCELKIAYDPAAECLSGYTLSGTVCKGTYSVAPIKKCPNDFSWVNDGTCNQVQTKPLKVCADDEVAEESFCKTSSGTTVPQKAYCDGVDVSGGSFCDGGKCYTYKPEWNACQITVKAPSSDICQVGTYTSGTCQVSDEYKLNMQCPFGFNRDGVLCKRIEIIDPIKSCENGFTLVGSTCSKTEVAPYTACPSTHYLLNGRCHATSSTTINCPANYSWNGSDCEKNDQKPALPVCDVDHTFNGTVCQKDEIVQATPVCPVDYVAEGAKCSNKKITGATPICPAGYSWSIAKEICEEPQEIPAIKNCPLGYSLDGLSCKKPEELPATGSCTAADIALGYSWNGTQCTKTENQSAEINCPPDKPWNGTTCEKINKQPAELNCPVNYTWDGTQCVKPDSTAATINCPSGHTWNGTSCQKNESIPATGNCTAASLSAGYSWNGSSCSKDESQGATPSCSSGFSWNGSSCTKDESQGATPACSSGFSWNGSTCTKTESLSASPSCAAGFTWNGSTCAQNESQGASPSCAAGFTWNGSACAKNESQGATPSCSAGFTWNGFTCAKNDSMLATESKSCPEFRSQMCGAGKWPVDITVEMGKSVCTYSDPEHCQAWSTTAPIKVTYSCPSGWTVSGSTCIRTTTQAPTYSCPSGWTVSGSTCNRTATQAPTYSCPSGWTQSGSTCNRTATQAPTYSCPSGWTQSGSTCNRTSTQSPTYSCPAGWNVSGSNCNRTLSGSLVFSCPSSGGWSLSVNQCNRTLNATPTYSCPSSGGWSLVGTSCERTLTQPQTYSCPALGGWVLQGSECSQSLTQLPVYTCPSNGGWQVVGKNCSRNLLKPTAYQCPPAGGWVLDKDLCNRTLVEVPTHSCPPAAGWVLNTDKCNRTSSLAPDSYECPVGQILDGVTCTATTIKDPDSYQCLPGWINELDKCRLTTTKPVSNYECDPEWTLDDNICRILLKSPETRTCPLTHTQIDPLRCYLNIPATNVGTCEEGWASNLTHCTLGVSKPADLSCLPSHQLIASQCHTTITQPVTVECQPDETFEGGKCVMTRNHSPVPLCPTPYQLENPTSCKSEIVIPKFK